MLSIRRCQCNKGSVKSIPADGTCPVNTECWYWDTEDALAGTDELRGPDDCQAGTVESPVDMALVVTEDVVVTRTGCDAAELLSCCRC